MDIKYERWKCPFPVNSSQVVVLPIDGVMVPCAKFCVCWADNSCKARLLNMSFIFPQ